MKYALRIGFLSAFLALPVLASAQSAFITRADFVVNMMASKGLYGNGGNCFPDVTNQSFAPAVCEAKARGYVRGYGDGKFHPYQDVTLVDAAVLAMRVEGVSLPGDSIWYRPAIEKLADWDAIPDSIMSIATPLTVSQANEVLISVRNRGDDDDNDNNDDNVDHDDDNDDLTVSITESDQEVDEGDTVTYRIRIKNDDNHDKTVDVRAVLDNDMRFVSASDDGDDHGDDDVRWDDVDIDSDDDVTLSLTVRIDSSAGDTVKLHVDVDGEVDEEETDIGNNGDGNDDNNDDITLSVEDSEDPVRPNGTVTYRIRLENDGNSDERIDVRARLDNDMEFISATNGGDDDHDEVVWDNVHVNEDDTVTLLLTVRMDSSLDDGDEVQLRVDAAGDVETEKTEIDDNGSNDRTDDVEVSIAEAADPVEEGEVITYRITITNRENNPVSIDATAFLDDETSYVSSTDSGDLHGDDEVQWDSISIARDSSKTILLSVRPRSTVNDGDSVTLRVEAEDDEDTETTRIEDSNGNGNGDIRLSIDDSDDPVAPGDTVTYEILIENRDNDDATVDVRARLDGDMTFVSASDGGDLSGSEVSWSDVDIHGDDDVTLTLRVRIRTSADDGDTVRLDVRAEGEDESETTDIED